MTDENENKESRVVEGVAGLFPQTSWALLDAARGGGDLSISAFDEFARRYYRPVYAYIAAILRDPGEAEDLAQGFFVAAILSGRLLMRVDRARGSFRPYLKQAIRNYVIDELRKRGREQRRLIDESMQSDESSDRLINNVPASSPAPDAAFHTAWVQSLLEEALVRVQAICESKGQQAHFQLFLGRYLSESSDPPSWRELGEAFGLGEKAARSRTETVASHFRVVIRKMLIDEVGSEPMADEEIAALLALM
ncbi:MAG: sigma-70 family RNA polymerase sigma factor [Blastocatellia bacterium]|nr:sigma-70 family RNA polymerase sigma factor [Blastocatellia bacterium]